MKRSSLIASVTVICALASPLWAASEAELDELYAAMRTDELLQIMADEGLADGEELREDMLGGQGGLGWNAALAKIYAHARMTDEFRAIFDAELAETDVTPLLDFYASEVGRDVALFEIESRRALARDEVEAAAKTAYAELDESSERHRLLTHFTRLNDLVENNVAGAMTSNLAFFQGMAKGGGLEMGEAEILATVWAREDEIRSDTTEWVGAFLAFAYARLSDEDLAAYIALSETPAGRDLNRALFASFFDVYKRISFDLGKSVSSFMGMEEL